MATRRRFPQGPARAALDQGLDNQKCHTPKCGRPATNWSHLAYWCDAHHPDETPAANCGHIDTMLLHDKLVCSWCGGLLKENT